MVQLFACVVHAVVLVPGWQLWQGFAGLTALFA
jgi:hypothetical protein